MSRLGVKTADKRESVAIRGVDNRGLTVLTKLHHKISEINLHSLIFIIFSFVISCVGIFVYRGFYFGLYDTAKPIFLGEDAGLLLSFCLGYGVTVTAGMFF